MAYIGKVYEEVLQNMDRFQLFSLLLKKLSEGMTIIFNQYNVCEGDRFLILYNDREIVCTFRMRSDGVWKVWFDGSEPMLLEDCPESFFRSILLNIK